MIAEKDEGDSFRFQSNLKSSKGEYKRKYFDCTHAIKSLKCRKCSNFETDCLTNLRKHVEAGHVPVVFEQNSQICKHCGFETHSKLLYARHKLVFCVRKDAKKEQRFKCQYCPHTVKARRFLKSHILHKHTDPHHIQWFQCPQCCYKSKSKSGLKCHTLRVHCNTQPLRCNYCPFEAKRNRTLKNHILTKHTESEKIQWYQCSQCPYKTKIKFYLKGHVDRKHNATTIKCDLCPFEAKCKQNLRSHLLWRHTDGEKIKWFECEQCDYKTRIRSCLRYHITRKHGQNGQSGQKRKSRSVPFKFKCEHCPIVTKCKQSLRDHILSKHTSELDKVQWFECAKCPYKSPIKVNLKRHSRTHTPPRLKCDYCHFVTKLPAGLRAHVFRLHPDKAPMESV